MELMTREKRHAPGINREDFDNGRVKTAISQCKKLLRLNPQDEDGWDYMGESYASLNQTDEAANCYEKVLRLNPYRPKTRLSLALQRIQQNRLGEAKKLIKEEIKRFKNNFKYNTEVAYLLAKINLEEKNYRETINLLDSVRAEFPEKIDCWEWTIQALSQLQNASRLKSLYKELRIIELRKDREWVQTFLVTKLASLEKQHRPEHETIKEFLKTTPDNGLLNYSLASAFERAEHLNSAIEKFQQVASNRENYTHIQANAWFRLGRLSSGNQREQFLHNCLELNSGHGEAKKLLKET
jgi:tetratricopeptide (TPR) repeat protein